jgi:hypothetical protein
VSYIYHVSERESGSGVGKVMGDEGLRLREREGL